MTTGTIQLVAGIGAAIVFIIIIWRRKSKSPK
jgi:ABC-type thiamin/hydroxymethylpyrimidine transport system permease subunit